MLTRIPVTFYNKAKDTDYRREGPVFRTDGLGDVVEVRWSPWLKAPVRLSIDQTELLYDALRKSYRLAEDPDNHIKIQLKLGDLLGFDNRPILHGRTGFEPSTGGRWLQVCYVEREELHSRLRILARRRRSAE